MADPFPRCLSCNRTGQVSCLCSRHNNHRRSRRYNPHWQTATFCSLKTLKPTIATIAATTTSTSTAMTTLMNSRRKKRNGNLVKKKKKEPKSGTSQWVPMCVFNYKNVIKLWVMEIKIRNRVMKIQTIFLVMGPNIFELWVMETKNPNTP